MRSTFYFIVFACLCISSCSTTWLAAGDRLTKDANYERALNWIKNNNNYGSDSPIVLQFTKELEQAIGKRSVTWEIGWGITRSGDAYKLLWTPEELVITPLSKEQAEQLGFKELATRCTLK